MSLKCAVKAQLEHRLRSFEIEPATTRFECIAKMQQNPQNGNLVERELRRVSSASRRCNTEAEAIGRTVKAGCAMVIKSPFKDYYDFVANQYGGGDPAIVYVRNRLAPMERTPLDGLRQTWREVTVLDDCPLSASIWWRPEEGICEMFLSVAGRAYVLRKKSDLNDDDPNTYTVIPPAEIDCEERKRGYYGKRYRGFEFGKESAFLVELSRTVAAPVFAIQSILYPYRTDTCVLRIPGPCPVLKEVGMPALVPPQQMYQDLAYFVGNTMKPHPDTEPPVEVSNRQKIVKAGFDLKQSFRHRL